MSKSKAVSACRKGNYLQGIALCLILIMPVLMLDSSNVFAAAKLKAKVPALCFNCHQELEKGLSDRYVHFLFKQGKCITCHNSHVSKVKGLIIDDIDSLCLNCHIELRKMLDKGAKHSALREHNCTECHFAHSGMNKSLLVKAEKDLCMDCHKEMAEQLNKPYSCGPFKEGTCSACHNSHASAEDNLLIAPPVKLCKECHVPKCKVGQTSIVSAVMDMDCTGCHSGHSSNDKGLLGPFGHKAFLDKKCEECHGPISSEKKITTSPEGEQLCMKCHKKETAIYKYNNNDLHVKGIKNPCITCHDYHASGRKNLTINESKLCLNCHEGTEKRTAAMEKTLKTVECKPVRERKCFECHLPAHSDRILNFREDEIALCARCHESEHKTTHPLGEGVMDPRSGRQVTCNSCHSMHSASADFMLTYDRKRALCIQCHKM